MYIVGVGLLRSLDESTHYTNFRVQVLTWVSEDVVVCSLFQVTGARLQCKHSYHLKNANVDCVFHRLRKANDR